MTPEEKEARRIFMLEVARENREREKFIPKNWGAIREKELPKDVKKKPSPRGAVGG